MSTVAAPIGSTAGGAATDTSRLSSKANLDAAGQRFEAIFTGMMLKSMRAAKLGDGLFDSKAGEQFRDMQDQQLAQAIAVHAPMGIGKAMTQYLAKAANLPADASTATTATAAVAAAVTTNSAAPALPDGGTP